MSPPGSPARPDRVAPGKLRTTASQEPPQAGRDLVTGFDVDKGKVVKLQKADGRIGCIDDEAVRAMRAQGFEATVRIIVPPRMRYCPHIGMTSRDLTAEFH